MLATGEILGDQSYVYTDPSTGEQSGVPVSSQLDLEPSPEFADKFRGLGPYEARLAQAAYNVFHQPFAQLARKSQGLPNAGYAYGANHFIERNMLPELEAGFKLLRWIMGETEYGGLELEISEDEEQTELTEYFDLASRRRMVINKWKGDAELPHDLAFHLMGGLLASSGVVDIIEIGAETAKDLESKEDRKGMGDAIDFSLSSIQHMWLGPLENKADNPGLLSDHLNTLLLATLSDDHAEEIVLVKEKALQASQNQADLITVWQRERPFVVAEPA